MEFNVESDLCFPFYSAPCIVDWVFKPQSACQAGWLKVLGGKYLLWCATCTSNASAKNSGRLGPAGALWQTFSINYLYNL